ncbi:MAG: ribonuclease H-like domain-containing protein [Clostridium sp.]
MITIKKKLDLPMTYPLERFCSLDNILFFDIETTGFSGDYSVLYLIGCTYYKDNSWHLIQWFSDYDGAEEDVLHAFFHFLTSFTTLIHFNGDGFDIPYLLKRCRAYNLCYDFTGITSIDIYRLIKPYKKVLGLDSLKQKSIECFLGVCREDEYSGGQLIEVYYDYLETHETYLYNLLILHNEDDLKGMPSILPILYYHDFLNGEFTFEDQHLTEKTDIFGTAESELVLSYKSDYVIPVPIHTENSCFTLDLDNDQLYLTVSLFEGELKHFYSDYENYYYLIYEDNAIHKSVGQYVEKGAKKKASARTCYTRISGIFLPQPSVIWEPLLKADYRDKITYVSYVPELFSEPTNASRYLEDVLKGFFIK